MTEIQNSSFKRKISNNSVSINSNKLCKGIKTSVYTNRLVVSSGITSLDIHLAGGLQIGTCTLLEEDVYGGYAKIMKKLFLSEGVVNGHNLFLHSGPLGYSQPSRALVKELPALVVNKKSKINSKPPGGDSMQIAWRYADKKQVDDSSSSSTHYFDMGVTLQEEEVNRCRIKYDDSKNFDELLTSVKEFLKNQEIGQFSRILLSSMDSICHSVENLRLGCRFISELGRSLNKPCVVMVTCPTHLLEKFQRFRLHTFCDYVFHVDSFIGTKRENDKTLKEYHGFFNIMKLSSKNSLCSFNADSLFFAFKLFRKRFSIERIHLPPELSSNSSREQIDKRMEF